MRFSFVLLAALWMSSSALHAGIITINPLSSLSPSQQAAFNQAEAFWESALPGYQNGITLTGLTINAQIVGIDGAGGILGSAGPSTLVTQAGFTLTLTGLMRFDSADVANLEANGSFGSVVLHEMAHVLGLGTLWTNNGVYINNSGQYTGALGLAEYRTEFNQTSATFIPVELEGGAGTANGHWNEVSGGAGLTGIRDSQGRDMRNELMTGWLNSPTFVSRMTVASFGDLGYQTNLTAVPEPSSCILVALAAGFAGFVKPRRSRAYCRPSA